MVKNLPAVQETQVGSQVGKIPGEGNGNPLQYSCLENSMDRGAWQATVHGVAKSRTGVSNYYSLMVRAQPTILDTRLYHPPL